MIREPRRTLPVPTRREDIVEMFFGTKVADPYRWLEAGDSPEVKAWVRAQNAVTERFLVATGLRASLRARIRELLSIGSISRPRVRRRTDGTLRYFYRRREGPQNQPLLLVRDGVDGADRTLLDPNRLSARGTVALDWVYPSKDGSLVAYGLSQNGSEQSTLFVRNVKTGNDLGDSITRTRFASLCWQPKNQGFYYTRYPDPASVPKGQEGYHRWLYYHRLGDDPDSDRELFGKGRDMTDFLDCELSPNGRWLMVSAQVGWNKTELYLADTTQTPLAFVELTEGKEHNYSVQVDNDAFYVLTNDGASRYRLLRGALRAARRSAWTELIGEHETDVLDDFFVARHKVLACYSRAAVSRLERFDQEGRSLGAVPLPGIGSTTGISGVFDSQEAIVDFETFTEPRSMHRVNLKSGEIEPWLRVQTGILASNFEVTRHSTRSKDGTQIPFVRVAKRDLGAGPHPTLLYGYGGFNISMRPSFTPENMVFLEAGGVFVQAILRGGGEGGEAWHRQGQRENKQNVFDDFLAVAKTLIKNGETSKDKLAIYGRSNGGLLVAAALTQAPELFRAAVSAVPLTDMVRYPRFLIAKLWVPEYGSPDKPSEFKWLYDYSPYHRVRQDTDYPATLFMTAESDTRVDPAHARKMTAAMQWATSSEQPVLLRTELEAGHGAGKPTDKRIEEAADLFAFLMNELKMKPR